MWVNGDVLTAPDLDAEFDNIINNAVGLISPLTTTLNAGFNQVTGLLLEQNAAPSNTTTGYVFMYTPNDIVYIAQNGTYRTLGPQTFHQGRVSGLTGSLISNIGSFAAQGYSAVQSGLGSGLGAMTAVTATSSFSVNTQTAGPIVGGRDQAAPFASTDIHFYMISTGLGSTSPQGICSSSPPPTGPTISGLNYFNWTYLCSAKYNVGSSVESIIGNAGGYVRGGNVYPRAPTVVDLLTNGAAIGETDVNIGSYVPSISPGWTMSLFNVGGMTAAVGSGLVVDHSIYAESGLIRETFRTQIPSTAASAAISMGTYHVTVPNLRTTPEFGYRGVVTVGTSGHISARLISYRVPNGDN